MSDLSLLLTFGVMGAMGAKNNQPGTASNAQFNPFGFSGGQGNIFSPNTFLPLLYLGTAAGGFSDSSCSNFTNGIMGYSLGYSLGSAGIFG